MCPVLVLGARKPYLDWRQMEEKALVWQKLEVRTDP
jgi:hypothetical protein